MCEMYGVCFFKQNTAYEMRISDWSSAVCASDLNITAWPQPRRARAGMGRSYQRTTIFPSLTVHENCRLAAQANHQAFWNWTAPASKCRISNEAAEHAISLAGLESDSRQVAGLLSHGRKRQLEIAMSLATRPSVLLLDETLAGVGSAETDGLLEILARSEEHTAELQSLMRNSYA